MADLASTVTLSGGQEMPRVGLGTWPMSDEETERAVISAIEAGYRLFDTAENYRNERGVGRGMRASGLPREQLFVTTKFNREWHGKERVRHAFTQSADLLGVDYIDLLLIHWPNPEQNRYVEAWQGLIQLRDEGLVRAIGVSNFKPAHLERLREETGVMPEVNQVQLNPFLPRNEIREYDHAHGIVTESWAPLSKGHDRLLHASPVTEIAARHGKTPAQVVLRWHLELGVVPIPKSSSPARMRENIGVFDFELDPPEIDQITGLNGGAGHPADSDQVGH